VSSTIIGARRIDQLERLAALDVKLTDAHVEALNKVSKPTLNFSAVHGRHPDVHPWRHDREWRAVDGVLAGGDADRY
jgi:hypothetical protein